MKTKSPYSVSDVSLKVTPPNKNTKWKILAIITIVVIMVNGYLSFVVSANQLNMKLDMLIPYVIGNILGLPIIIFLLSQIWKKHRNRRSRIKSILYPSFLVLFLLIFSFIGLISDNFQESKEEKRYSYISLAYSDEIEVIQIKETPKSQCEKWRNDYFTAGKEKCDWCEVLANDCRKEIPEIYHMAFQQKDIEPSYIYKPYKYPEIMVFKGLPEDKFSQMCSMAKGSLATSTCFK